MLYGSLYEDKLKNVPKGFPKDFKDKELLKYKSFIVAHPLTNKELMAPAMKEKFKIQIQVLNPFIAYLNRAIDFKEEVIDF